MAAYRGQYAGQTSGGNLWNFHVLFAFSLCPKGEYKISVCLGTACYVKGAAESNEKLQEKLHISGGECTEDGKFSLDACRCIGACGLAPVMTINDDVYGRLTGDELDEILAKY